jgi:hypothetical protein
MVECPVGYSSISTVCVPNSYELTPAEILTIREKLVELVLLVVPDRIPKSRLDSEKPHA